MSKDMTYLFSIDSKTMLNLYVQPGASKNEIIGLYGEPTRLKIKIKAPPQDGEANAEVIAFLAKIFRISKNKIEIKRGHISKMKDVLIDKNIKELMIDLNL